MTLHLKATGIDFVDFGSAGGMASELLDDYEEGTFSVAHAKIYTTTAQYTKIGRQINPNGEIKTGAVSSDDTFNFDLPFTCAGQAGSFATGRTNPQQQITLNSTNGTVTCLCEAMTSLANNGFFYFSHSYYAT